MASRARRRLRGLERGLASLPDGRGWLESAAASLVLAVVAAPVALRSGLILSGAAGATIGVRTLVVPFLIPALLEECLFRGLLLPHPIASGLPVRRRAPWWAVSLALYVASHPLVAALLRPRARPVFDAPAFLLEAALLGVTATALYERTGSLWPGVLLHGALVAAWLTLGGVALLGA